LIARLLSLGYAEWRVFYPIDVTRPCPLEEVHVFPLATPNFQKSPFSQIGMFQPNAQLFGSEIPHLSRESHCPNHVPVIGNGWQAVLNESTTLTLENFKINNLIGLLR
jgi:hypothetical protein